MIGQNISNQTFTDLDEDIVACNVEDCVFENVENIKFERNNMKRCVFKSTSYFDRCNLIACELVEGSIYDKTNIIDEEEEPEQILPEEE